MGAASVLSVAGCTGSRAQAGPWWNEPRGPPPGRTCWCGPAHGTSSTTTPTTSHQVRSRVGFRPGPEEDMRGRVDDELKAWSPIITHLEVTNTKSEEVILAYMADSNRPLNGTGLPQWRAQHSPRAYWRGRSPCADTAPKTLRLRLYTTCLTYALPEGVGVLSLIYQRRRLPRRGRRGRHLARRRRCRAGVRRACVRFGDIVPVRWDAREDGVLEPPASFRAPGSADPRARPDQRRGRGAMSCTTCRSPTPTPGRKTFTPTCRQRPRLATEGGRQMGRPPSSPRAKIPGCPPTGSSPDDPAGVMGAMAQTTVDDDDDKPLGFREAGRPGLVAWRVFFTEVAGSAGRHHRGSRIPVGISSTLLWHQMRRLQSKAEEGRWPSPDQPERSRRPPGLRLPHLTDRPRPHLDAWHTEKPAIRRRPRLLRAGVRRRADGSASPCPPSCHQPG